MPLERGIELANSARCALQYAVGLHVDTTRNLAVVSYGEFDKKMKLAALPLDKLVGLADIFLIMRAMSLASARALGLRASDHNLVHYSMCGIVCQF